MAQIPTSSITMAAIIAEVGLSGSKTLDECRAASIAYTMSSTGVPGHTRDGTEQTNTNAANWNNTMAEWAGYVHTQDFPSPDYYVRTGTAESAFCVQNSMSITDAESAAVSDTVFYMKLTGMYVEFYMDIDHTKQYTPLFGETSISRTASWRNTSGTSQSFSGSFSSGFTPVRIARVNCEDGSSGNLIGSITASISSSVFSGTGTHDAAVSGYTIGDGGSSATGSRTPHTSTLYGVAPAAWTLVTGCFSQDVKNPFHRVVCKVNAPTYNEITLNTFVADHYAAAVSDGCV